MTSRYGRLIHLVALTLVSIFSIPLHATDSKGISHVGNVVEWDTYGIKVVKAEIMTMFKDMHGTVSPVQPDHQLLVLEIKFYENKKPSKNKVKEEGEMQRLSLVDVQGNSYPVPLSTSGNIVFRYVLYGANPRETIEKEGFTYQIFFSVPTKSTGFQLKYRNLPPIGLGL